MKTTPTGNKMKPLTSDSKTPKTTPAVRNNLAKETRQKRCQGLKAGRQPRFITSFHQSFDRQAASTARNVDSNEFLIASSTIGDRRNNMHDRRSHIKSIRKTAPHVTRQRFKADDENDARTTTTMKKLNKENSCRSQQENFDTWHHTSA